MAQGLSQLKSQKGEEVRKLSAALDVARTRGEALARELASAHQHFEDTVRQDGASGSAAGGRCVCCHYCVR